MPTTPALDQTHKKRKFGGSGEIDKDDIPIVESTCSTIVNSINHLFQLQDGKYNELRDLIEIKDKAEDALKSLLKNLKDLCKLSENADCDAKVCILPR